MPFLAALARILAAPFSFLAGILDDLRVFAWDFGLVILNLLAFPFKRKVGSVILEGLPGHGGKWPEYRPPREGDSRSCCPALNALANHGE